MSIISMVSEALLLARSVLQKRGDRAREEVRDEHVVDISTAGDRAISEALIGYFRKSGIPLILQSEESGILVLEDRPSYLIAFDDLDGTDNFFRGNGLLPYCTVIAVLKEPMIRFDDVIAAGIIELRTGTVWLAETGNGVTVDGVAAHPSRRSILDRRTLITIDHYGVGPDIMDLTSLHADGWVKDFGSSALHLAGVSNGLFDAYISTRQKGHEIAAGYLLIREAGGWMSDFSGQLFDQRAFDFNSTYQMVACTNKKLFTHIQSRIKR